MNPIARLEHACARLVEESFARVFPSDLEPAQVGRKLLAVMQATPSDLYIVRVHPADYARFEHDRDFLEARWSGLVRAGAGGRPAGGSRALLHADARVVAGSVTIEAVSDDRPAVSENRPAVCALERSDGSTVVLRDGLRLGRASDNDVPIRDRRVSRHHARIVLAGPTFAIEDIGSSNGTFVDGRRVLHEPLAAGSTVTLGDTHLRVRLGAG